jgi:cytochrome c-type biogenesis protein
MNQAQTHIQEEASSSSKNWLAFLVYIALVVGLTAGGYALFIYLLVNAFPNAASLGIIFVSIVAGIASFFNPCAFPILPGYLAQYYVSAPQKEERRSRLGVILFYGFVAAIGVIVFNIFLGAIVGGLGTGFANSLGLSGPEPNIYIRWFRGIVGAFLILLGYSHATGRGINFTRLGHWIPRYGQSKSPTRNFFYYGFFYPLIGIGCGGPILAGLSLFAFASGGFLSALSAFLIYSVVMAVLVMVVSLLVGLSREGLLRIVGNSVLAIKKISGVILLLVGAFLIFSAVFVQIFTKLLFP